MGKVSKTFTSLLTLAVVISCLTMLTVKPANAQVAQTLGPVQIRSSGDGGTNVQILMPQNKTNVNSPVNVLFCVKVALLPYSSPPFADIGYSVDNGNVYRVGELINQTLVRGTDVDEATIWAGITLGNISVGSHSLVIYVGVQFEGVPENPQLQRYEVWAYSTANFSITSKPSATVPEFSWLMILPLFFSMLFVVVLIRKRRVSEINVKHLWVIISIWRIPH